MPLLTVDHINTFYDVFQAIFDVSLVLERGEVVCLLGRNGAGKTTTLNSIAGLNPPRSGRVLFMGTDITGRKPYRIARLGMGYVPETRLIFPDLTVVENLELGHRQRDKRQLAGKLGHMFELFPRLESLKHHLGGRLSGGEQQMLTIARSLMGEPELLLLDELTTGLAPIVVQLLKTQVAALKQGGLTILLTEQNALFALDVSDRGYVMDKGTIVYDGLMKDLKDESRIMMDYLGV